MVTTRDTDKLDKLFKEGKITGEEYNEIKNNLPGRDSLLTPGNFSFVDNPKPGLIWVLSGVLLTMAIIHLVFFIEKAGVFSRLLIMDHRSVPFLISSLLEVILSIGIYKGIRWIFLVTVIFTVLAVLVSLFYGKFNIQGFVLNGTFLVLSLWAWEYFYKIPPWKYFNK